MFSCQLAIDPLTEINPSFNNLWRDSMPAFVLENLCSGCKRCVNACPVQVIALKAHLPVVDGVKCVECETCLEVCMHGAITFRKEVERVSRNG